MAAKISPTVVGTTPNETVLAKDGKGKTPTQTINNTVPNQPTEVGESQKEQQKSGIKLPWGLIEKQVLKKISDPKISSNLAQQQLEKTIGSKLVSIYNNDVVAVAKATEAYRNDATGRDKTSLVDAAGNVKAIYDRTDPSKVASLSQSIKRIGSTVIGTGFIDNKGTFAVGLGLLDQAIALGVPELIDDVVQILKNNKEAKRVLIEGTQGTILRSDIPTLNKILDLVGSAGVLQKVPDAISLLLSSYRFAWGTTPEDYPSKRIELISVLERIKPNWSYTTRGITTVSNLAETNYMSSSAKTLLMLVPSTVTDATLLEQPYVLEAIMSAEYRYYDLKDLTASMYPELAIWG